MSEILEKLQRVKDAQAKVRAKWELATERLVAVDEELAALGVEGAVDLDALEKALTEKLAEFDAGLTRAEDAIKKYNDGRSNEQSALSEG